MSEFIKWLLWLWQTRNCPHPRDRLRRISGDERMYGYGYRCRDCDKPLKQEDLV